MKRLTGSSPFAIDPPLRLTPSAAVNRLATALLGRVSGLSHLHRLYLQAPQAPLQDQAQFLQYVIELFDINLEFDRDSLARIPRSGPLVIVANHPFGAIEGILLAFILKQVRSDIKIMANYFLQRVPQLDDLFIGVDPFGGNNATAKNQNPMREAVRWLADGHLLVVFPSGTVSHLDVRSKKVRDPEWMVSVARLIKLAKAPVLPVFFPGRNSLLFQLAGLVHPLLRTLLIPRELLNKQGQTIKLQLGNVLAHSRLQDKPDADLIKHLRMRTYMLGQLSQLSAPQDKAEKKAEKRLVTPQARYNEALIKPVPANLLKAEILQLPSPQCLIDNSSMQVLYATANQIPWTLREIGRLREHTFRLSGEGTGKSIDTDLYDNYYLHLFVWDKQEQCIVGAYRLGLADEIVQKYGVQGLYTHTLFRYNRQLIRKLAPAIELGRSFIRPEYQKGYAPLMLLWKGICAFVAAHPKYKNLFGPVSISNDYDSVSRQLLVQFLRHNNYQTDLARLVRARSPFRQSSQQAFNGGDLSCFTDLDSISEIIAQLESDQKGIPILLKQYLKLGGTLLGFNVDPDFNDALDGLIMVDLTKADNRLLQKYMGADGVQQFLAAHTTPLQRAS